MSALKDYVAAQRVAMPAESSALDQGRARKRACDRGEGREDRKRAKEQLAAVTKGEGTQVHSAAEKPLHAAVAVDSRARLRHTTHCRGWPLVPPYPATLSLLHRLRHLYFISFLHLLPPPPPLGSSAGQKQLPLQGERGRRPEREQKPPPRGSGNACAESDRG